MQNECSFSHSDLWACQTFQTVACPQCGAIRACRPRSGVLVYPAHAALDADARFRPHYKRIGEQWQWIESEEK